MFHMLSATLIVTAGNDLVDAVKQIAGQVDPVGSEVAVQVFHGARTDDRGGDRRVAGGERDGHLDEGDPGLVGESAEGIGGVELGDIGRVGGVIGPGETLRPGGGARPADLLALAVFARQPAPGQRAVGHDAHSVAQAGRQHVVFDGAGQQGVGGLLGTKPSVAAALSGPLGLDDLGGGNLRCAEVPDLAGLDEVGQGAEGLVDIGVRIGHPYLVEVDPVGLQPAQRALDRFGDPPPRRSAMVGVVVAERNAELDGEHHVLAPSACQRLAQDLF